MNWFPILGCALLGFATVFLLVPCILKTCAGRSACRAPELHHGQKEPIPRFGGLALVGALIAVECFVALLFPEQRLRVAGRSVVIFGSLAMFVVGFWDDLKPLGAKRKLAAQILVSLFVWKAGVGIETFKVPFSGQIIALNGWSWVITVAWLVGITNLLNLIDGVDGLAGGIALMLMALLVYVGYQNGTFVFLTAGMTGALLGFLWFNFPPARIYLGDGGAYFLGFQIGLFAIVGSHKGSVFAALLAPLFVLALPIVDTGLAILRRGLRGLPVFRPDRRHIHHRLLGMGMSRRKVVLSLYGVTLVFLGMGFVAFWSRGHLAPVLAGLAVVLFLVCAGRLSFSREWFSVGRTLGNSLAMRQEVQYALCLTRWLKLEGGRCTSLDDLYRDLVFAAQRLGFTKVKVKLADGERKWERPASCQCLHSFEQDFPGARAGYLELQAPRCLGSVTCQVQLARKGGAQVCRWTGDASRFEIMSELLAEGWVGAASHTVSPDAVMRFDEPLPPVEGMPRRGRAWPFSRPAILNPRPTVPLRDDLATKCRIF